MSDTHTYHIHYNGRDVASTANGARPPLQPLCCDRKAGGAVSTDDFRPTYYNEETDITYLPGFPYAMRDQGLYNADELCVVVLGDIADCAKDAGMPLTAVAAEVAYRNARTALQRYERGEDEYPEWISDVSYYPPEGVEVDWDDDNGTVGWLWGMTRCQHCDEEIRESDDGSWVTAAAPMLLTMPTSSLRKRIWKSVRLSGDLERNPKR